MLTNRGFIEVEAGLKLDSSNAEIYEKAIEGFLEFMKGGSNEILR